MKMKLSFVSILSASSTAALDIDPANVSSLSTSAATISFNLLSPYVANASGTPTYVIGTLPQPMYWWHAGAMWGAMTDYWAITNDTSYNPSLTQALISQIGPNADLMPPQYLTQMGNDDIAFWAFAVLSALEYDLPFPTTANLTGWLQLADRVFNGFVSRWDNTTCKGGLHWQVPTTNAGYTYKNSVSNGGFFQVAARLYRYTGNSTYLDWATQVWDWSASVGLIDASSYAVYDGTDSTINCASVDHDQWTYNAAIYLGGSAYLYNATNGSTLWGDRALNLLAQANLTFANPFPNVTGVIFEAACELQPVQLGIQTGGANGCSQDQLTFKAYFARWLGVTAILTPFLEPYIAPILSASAHGAGIACSGSVPSPDPASPIISGLGINDTICAQHFFSSAQDISTLSGDGYFGNLTIGQKIGHSLAALEVVTANIPLVDGRSEDEGGPRSIGVGPGVTIAPAPSTSVVLPSKRTETPAAGEAVEGSAGGSNKGVGVGEGILGVVGAAAAVGVPAAF